MDCPDNYSQWARHDAEQEAELARRPKCYECGHPIQDEKCFEINGELICPGCMKENHEKHTEDYCE